MKAAFITILGLSLLAVPGLMLQPALTLQVTAGTGYDVICSPVAPGTPVVLEFTHSMYGGFVQEHYRINDEGILERQQVITENAAAAEYYATDGQTRRIVGGFEVMGGTLVTDDLIIRVDDRGDHWLTVGPARYHLAEMLPGSAQIHIHGERASCA